MKTLKKNNKGFSLVELIVVILIMAIIAVALAPQVMKWVDTAKENSDENNIAMLKSVTDAAIADYMASENKTAPTVTVWIEKGKDLTDTSIKSADPDESTKKFVTTYLKNTMNCPANQLPEPQSRGDIFVITIISGAVTVTINSSSGDVVTPSPTPAAS